MHSGGEGWFAKLGHIFPSSDSAIAYPCLADSLMAMWPDWSHEGKMSNEVQFYYLFKTEMTTTTTTTEWCAVYFATSYIYLKCK